MSAGLRPDVAAAAKLDGKYLLRSGNPHLSAEDVALGYKQPIAIGKAGCPASPPASPLLIRGSAA